MTRTYGKITLNELAGRWMLELEPQVAIRLKRVFARATAGMRGIILLTDTTEVARDLEWVLERWPLDIDPLTAVYLKGRADQHRATEARIAEILVGGGARLDLPQEPARPPRDYQRTAVDMLRARRSLLLTDELGLGKTYTALLSLVHPDALPAIVVPPTHLPRRWITELTDSFPWLTWHLAAKTTPPTGWAESVKPDVLIIPYSRLAGWELHLNDYARTIIFDEVQEVRRGRTTDKGMAAGNLAEQATYVLGLTATPVYNYGGEVWHIMNILARGALGNANEFSVEWGARAAGLSGHMKITDPAGLGGYLREQGLLLGRTRAEVGRELPKTIKTIQIVDADPAALEAVAGDAAAMARLILNSGTSRTDRFKASGDLDWKLRQATGIAKAPYVAEFCRLLLQSENKIILFGWHRAVYELWNEALAEFNPVMYTGSENPKQKAAAEQAFVEGDARILIMSLRSGSGVDGLQLATNVVVFGELDWSPQVHEQGIGRVRRDGMDDAPPVAYFLVTDDGADPAILEVLDIKRNQAEPIISPDGRLLTNSTQDLNRGRALAELVLRMNSARTSKATTPALGSPSGTPLFDESEALA